MTYLGYKLNKHGYTAPDDKIAAISTYPRPQTCSDLRRFLGMLNYYRSTIHHAAHQQAPLHEFWKDAKKKDKRPVPWTPETIQAFESCRQSIVDAMAISFISPTAQLTLITDASDLAIGASLEQREHGKIQPLGFFSRKLSPAERNYSAYDRNLLAVFESIKFFEHTLDGRDFKILTDHKPLTHAFQQRSAKASNR